MENDIKNCPFCGGEANLFCEFKIEDPNDEYSPNGYFVKCECETCGARGKEFISLENPADVKWDNMACRDAIKAWNMRYNENNPKPQSNPKISDIALKMAIAYAQVKYENDLKTNKIPFEIDEMDVFECIVTDTYKYYNSFDMETILLETEAEE